MYMDSSIGAKRVEGAIGPWAQASSLLCGRGSY